MLDLQRLLSDYDENRFVQAYDWVRPIWPSLDGLSALSVEELVHGGRLAYRVGGYHYRNHLFDLAYEKEPQSPLVQYFARYTNRRRWHILTQLSDYEENTLLKTDCPILQASWLASQATFFASIRNFKRAHELLDRAREFGQERPWISCCTAEVFIQQDKRKEALRAAEEAWQSSLGMPAAASILGKTLTQSGHVDKAARELMAYANTSCQSFEVALVALWYQLAHAEGQQGRDVRSLNEEANELARKLDSMAPLADSITKMRLTIARLDCAFHIGDDEAVAQYTKELKSPFFKAIRKNLKGKKEGSRRILPYRPVYQKRNACVPASVASVLGTFSVHLDEDELANELTYRGTALWRAVYWLREKGFIVRPFLASPDIVCKLIDEGVTFVHTFTGLTASHAVAVIGIDKNAGTMIWHDPDSERWGQILLDRMKEGEEPVGPLAFAVVPKEKAHLLDCLANEHIEAHDTLLAYESALDKASLEEANGILKDFEAKFEDTPFAQRLRARHYLLHGDRHKAIELLEGLLEDYPACLALRMELLHSLRLTRNTARVRQVLKDIVEEKRLPGIRKNETWRYPPTTYVVQYADYVGVRADNFKQAIELLHKALERTPLDATAHHVLGDILWRKGDFEKALISFRVASSLAETDEHYAQAYCNTLRLVGREEEGLNYLRLRVGELGSLLHGGQVYGTLVSTLEDYGYPDEAIDVLENALQARPEDSLLAAFAASFWLRMGRWEEARTSLGVVKEKASLEVYSRAAAYFYHRAGKWRQALEHCQNLLIECPDDLDNCRLYLLLLAQGEGEERVLARALEWSQKYEDHDDFEELLYEQLRNQGKAEQCEKLIRQRLKRNEGDVWAWRELGHILLNNGVFLDGGELETVCDKCRSLSPQAPATVFLLARVCKLRGDTDEAIDLYFSTLEQNPSLLAAYDAIHSLLMDKNQEELQAAYSRMEDCLSRSTEKQLVIRSFVFSKATTLGFDAALDTVEKLRRECPDVPELIETWADLHLHFGSGRRSAKEVIEFLEKALNRFPNHFDLRFSLAHAYKCSGEPEREEAAFAEILRRQPLNSQARLFVAHAKTRNGEAEKALELLKEGTDIQPLDCSLWNGLADFCWDEGLIEEALDVYEKALVKLPRDDDLLESYVSRLSFLGAHDRALAVIDEQLDKFDDRPYLHYLHAQILKHSEHHFRADEVEKSLRRALELDKEFYTAADILAVSLTEQHRYEEARRVMKNFPPMADDGPRQARLAWIRRQSGEKDVARREMCRVVENSPLSQWAWMRLMDWLEEDGVWTEAKEVVHSMPKAFDNDPSMRSRRLELLERAGVKQKELDEEWQRLIDDFPEHETLCLRRIDMLLDRKEYERARSIVDLSSVYHKRSPYLMARKVVVLAGLKDKEKALATALKLWSLPGDDGGWPEQTSWQAIKSACWEREAAEMAHKHVLEGKFLRLAAFHHVSNHLTLEWSTLPQDERDEELTIFLRALEAASWEEGEHRSIFLKALYGRSIISPLFDYWRSNEDDCRENIHLWQAFSFILGHEKYGSSKLVRQWMKDWREHEGAEMWSLTNYLMSLRTMKDDDAVCQELRDLTLHCLRNLKVDDSERLMATTLCEVSLRLHRDEEFIDHVDCFEKVLQEYDENHFYPQDYLWLPDFLPLFRDLLLLEASDSAWSLTRQLSKLMNTDTPPWIVEEWERVLSKNHDFIERKLLMGLLTISRIGKSL